MLFQSSSVTIEVSSNHFPAQNTQEVPISLRVKDKKGQHHPYPHAPSLSDLISFLSPHLLLQPLASNSSRKPGRLPRGIFTLVVPSAWNILYPKIYMATHSLPSGLYSKATCSVKPSLACYLALHIPSSAFFFPLALLSCYSNAFFINFTSEKSATNLTYFFFLNKILKMFTFFSFALLF